MDFFLSTTNIDKQRGNCLILPVFDENIMSISTELVNKLTNGFISTLIKKQDASGKIGQTLMLYSPPNILAERILLVGCGKKSELNAHKYIEILHHAALELMNSQAQDAVSYLHELTFEQNIYWKLRYSTAYFYNSFYRFDTYKTEKKPYALKKLTFIIENRKHINEAEKSIQEGIAIATSMQLTKNLANTPPNICTTEYLAKEALKLAKEYVTINTAILEAKELKALKMNALLAVGAGSQFTPKLITLEYHGNKNNKNPIVFVGKGITFDSGGHSLKNPTAMLGMKFDMSGAATVLGILKFAAQLNLPINLVGVIPTAENIPGPTAYRPDDIITTMAGITVEVLNTDAEGRLILCDALKYCERYRPQYVIDIATLTGACIIALGNHHSGLFSSNQELANKLLAAGQASCDKCWQLPISEEYHQQLESTCADIANVGGSEAGSITAACFLSKFATAYPWAHLDIAGTAFRATGKEKGATGRPVPMLAEFLLNSVKN